MVTLLVACFSGDPLSNLHVDFTSKEDAMDFCAKNGNLAAASVYSHSIINNSYSYLFYNRPADEV